MEGESGEQVGGELVKVTAEGLEKDIIITLHYH